MRQSVVTGLAGLASLGAAGASLPTPVAATEDLVWDQAKQLGAVSVRDRSRTAYEPDGIRIGNYLMFPEIGYRTTVATGDFGAGTGLRHALAAGVEMRSQFARHLLNLKVEGRAVADHDHDSLRYLDGTARLTGRLDITHRTSLFAEAAAERHHEENIDEDRPRGIRKPTAFTVLRGEGGLQHRMGRIDAAVGARYVRYDFEDALANDGTFIDQNARDYALLEPFVKLGARLSPGYRVFAEIAGRHQQNRGDALIDRDAEGMTASVGVDMELSPLVKLTLKGGYFYQDYRQAGLVDISTPTYSAHLDWYVTPLVTLTFGTSRSVEATSYGFASGRIATSYHAKVDYEMWRNLIVSAQLSLRYADYIGEPRTDTIWGGRLGVDYMISKHWLVALGYEHQRLESSDSNLDRSLDKFRLGVTYRF